MRLFLFVFCLISFKSYADPDTVLSKFVFFDNNGKVSHAGDFKWYRLKALKKEGELYPFTGYYPGGQLYVYGFYSSLDSGGIKNGYFLYYDSRYPPHQPHISHPGLSR